MSNSNSIDDNADAIIAGMVSGAIGAAVVPAAVNWAVWSSAMGVGVVAIGKCYGIALSKDEAWKLIKQFFLAAGFAWMGLAVGSKILAMILQTTGLGYGAAVAMDATISSALAYAIGASAKSYFKGDRDTKRLGEIFRQAFKSKKN